PSLKMCLKTPWHWAALARPQKKAGPGNGVRQRPDLRAGPEPTLEGFVNRVIFLPHKKAAGASNLQTFDSTPFRPDFKEDSQCAICRSQLSCVWLHSLLLSRLTTRPNCRNSSV